MCPYQKTADDDLLLQIALTKLEGIKRADLNRLIGQFRHPSLLFASSSKALRVKNLHPRLIQQIKNKETLRKAEKELKLIRENNIQTYFITDRDYPYRLRECTDGPALLYAKGDMRLNEGKMLSIVGTRRCSSYGMDFCEEIVRELQPFQPTIVSGLAYGIDICAHQAALKNDLQTIGVLGHGLDRIYPRAHAKVAEEMLKNGGILTDFPFGTAYMPGHFPSRNRIVAGLTDATIVIESKKKGGSLITADLANGYNREVFALPGRVSDVKSEGCNNLIKQHLAIMLQSAQDIVTYLNWDTKESEAAAQLSLPLELESAAHIILQLLTKHDQLHVDTIAERTGFERSQLLTHLLDLEMKGFIASIPGNRYRTKKGVKY